MFGRTFSYLLLSNRSTVLIKLSMRIVFFLTMLSDTLADSPGVSFSVLIPASITANLTALPELMMMLFLQNKAKAKS